MSREDNVTATATTMNTAEGSLEFLARTTLLVLIQPRAPFAIGGFLLAVPMCGKSNRNWLIRSKIKVDDSRFDPENRIFKPATIPLMDSARHRARHGQW